MSAVACRNGNVGHQDEFLVLYSQYHNRQKRDKKTAKVCTWEQTTVLSQCALGNKPLYYLRTEGCLWGIGIVGYVYCYSSNTKAEFGQSKEQCHLILTLLLTGVLATVSSSPDKCKMNPL